MRENFCGDIHAGIAFTPAEELEAYERMLLIRRFEEKAGQLYALGSIPGPCQLSIGQEAVAVGLDMAALAEDVFISGPRCHGLLIARGSPSDRMMAELMQKPQGLCRGEAGSWFMSDPSRGFYGGQACGSTAVALAAGLALAARQQKGLGVAVAMIGDGAEGQGATFEALEMAAALKLPLVVAIDNNRTGEADGPSPSIAGVEALAASLKLPVEKADGIDVRKVRAAARRALAQARAGEGPQLIEMQTYRYRGHGLPSGASREAPARDESDPLAKARRRMVEDRVATDEALKALERQVRDGVVAAANAARQGSCTSDAASETEAA